MMTAKHVAFYIGKNGLETWETKKINSLSRLFRSSMSLFNIAQCQRIPLENPLKVLAMGNKSNELCLLIIKGIDAELAHLVLLGYITEHFKIYPLTEKFNFSEEVKINCHFEHLTEPSIAQSDSLNKHTLLKKISSHIKTSENSNTTNALFLAREKFASTVMGEGVALPHIMSDTFVIPSIILTSLTTPIRWHENHPPVYNIIAITLPKTVTNEVLRSILNLTRELVNGSICHLLTNAPSELQPIILANILSGKQ